MWKIYVKGKYLFIEQGNVQHRRLKKEVEVTKPTIASDIYSFDDGEFIYIRIPLNEMSDEAETPYSKAAFDLFICDNTGLAMSEGGGGGGNATSIIKDSADLTIYADSIAPDGTKTRVITDSVNTIKNSADELVEAVNLKAQQAKETIIPDIDIQHNAAIVKTIPGNQDYNMQIVNDLDDSAAGAYSPGTDQVKIPSATFEVYRSNLALLHQKVAKSGAYNNYVLPWSYLEVNGVVYQQLNVPLTHNLLVQNAIGAPKGYKDGVIHRIDYSNIKANGEQVTDLDPETDLDLQIVLASDPNTQATTNVVNGKVEVDTDAGPTLIAYHRPRATQTTSNYTYDEGWQHTNGTFDYDVLGIAPIWLDYYNLSTNNTFGNQKRFTGKTGGYQQEFTTNYFDKDGNATTEILAFPDTYTICHYTGLGMKRTRGSAVSLTSGLATVNDPGLTVCGYTGDWFIPNEGQLLAVGNAEFGAAPTNNIFKTGPINFDFATFLTCTINLSLGDRYHKVSSTGDVANNATLATTSAILYFRKHY